MHPKEMHPKEISKAEKAKILAMVTKKEVIGDLFLKTLAANKGAIHSDKIFYNTFVRSLVEFGSHTDLFKDSYALKVPNNFKAESSEPYYHLLDGLWTSFRQQLESFSQHSASVNTHVSENCIINVAAPRRSGKTYGIIRLVDEYFVNKDHGRVIFICSNLSRRNILKAQIKDITKFGYKEINERYCFPLANDILHGGFSTLWNHFDNFVYVADNADGITLKQIVYYASAYFPACHPFFIFYIN